MLQTHETEFKQIREVLNLNKKEFMHTKLIKLKKQQMMAVK